MKTKDQIDLRREIYTDMERYRNIVNIIVEKDSKEMAEKEAAQFNGYIKLFPYLYSPDEGINLNNEPASEFDMSIPLDSTLLQLIQDAEPEVDTIGEPVEN